MRLAAVLLVFLAVLASACESRDQGLEPQSDVVRLEIVASAGSIHVTADPEVGAVLVTAKLEGSEARFVETRTDGLLRLETTCPRHFFHRPCRVDYTAVVPPGVELAVDTVDGDVDVFYDEVPTDVRLHSWKGDVHLTVPAGRYELEIESLEGEVVVDAAVQGDTNAPSSLGLTSSLGRIELAAAD